MRIFHGSAVVVGHPSLDKCRPHNDYGPGFYCTEVRELACEWACNRPGRNGFCNSYELDEAGLVVLDLDEHENGVLAWLAVLMQNRIFDMEWNAEQAKQEFLEGYRIDLSPYDLVCGYRADDSYFGIARAFVQGSITDRQAAWALRLGELGRQVVLRSPRAFGALRFLGADSVRAAEWYPRCNARDKSARQAFADMHGAPSRHDGHRIHELVD